MQKGPPNIIGGPSLSLRYATKETENFETYLEASGI
jgi:hypothetical protein